MQPIEELHVQSCMLSPFLLGKRAPNPFQAAQIADFEEVSEEFQSMFSANAQTWTLLLDNLRKA